MILAETERLTLRYFALTDVHPMMDVFGDADVMRFGDGVHTRAWVGAWLQACLESYQARGFGPYAVVERSSSDLIGYCGLFHFPNINGQPEIELGYRLKRAAWGQGYATEAARAVRDFAFPALNIQRLIALVDP